METLVVAFSLCYLALSGLLFYFGYRLKKVEERLYFASCAIVGDLNG